MPDSTPLRVALYSPDRARFYDGRTPERDGVGGGITARLSLAAALAALGHDVTAYVHCEAPLRHDGVRYVPLDAVAGIDCDVLITISTGGGLTFTPLRGIDVHARLRIVWVQGVPRPADLEAVAADYVYVASNFLRDVCATRWGVPEHRIFTCYNGIHQDYFRAVGRHAPARDTHAIAYVGPPKKGLAACISVLRRLRAEDDRFHLDVFGGDQLWGRAAGRRPDEPGVRFKGLLGQRALAEALFGYEYCLALQAMEEGFGIAVQEAKRAGAIVVASAVGALSELIRHGADGYLVEGAHESAAAQTEAADLITTLADDPHRRARVRRRATKTPWSWDLAARTWTAHWHHLFANGLQPRHAASGKPAALDLPDGRHVLSNGAYCPGVYPLSPMHERLGVDPPKHVFVSGYYGHGNLGDETILAMVLDQLEGSAPDRLPIVASGDPRRTSGQHDAIAIDDRDIGALRKAALASDAVVIGGGGLFHDYHGVEEAALLTNRHWGLTYCAALPVLAQFAGKPLAILGAGVGPLRTEPGQRYTRIVFGRADLATVRDAPSRDLLGAIGVDVTRVEVSADPAFLLAPAEEDRVRARLRQMGVPPGKTMVAVALRRWNIGIDPPEWYASVAAALDRIVAARDAAILFVPFQTPAGSSDEDDGRVARDVRKRMRHAGAATICDRDLGPSMVQGIFRASTVVVAMRLHAVILAANAGVPFVALRYDDKVGHAVNSLGLPQFAMDLGTVTGESLFQRMESALDARDQFAKAFADRLPMLVASAQRSFQLAADVLRSRQAGSRPSSPEWQALFDRARPALDAASPRRVSRPRTFGAIARSAARAAIPARWRPILREAQRRRLMSPAALVFDRYKRARLQRYGSAVGDIRAPGAPGLVSIVLPAFNGAAMIREALDSVLGQTYAQFELIVVDDGSTDATGAIADEYARADSRVRVIHQDNQRLPAALSRGFELARGEFLTWTSSDNRLKPACLESLVGCLRRHPRWDMVYANVDLIGEDGRALEHSPHYASYQRPHGSAHVHLPASPVELNVRANNFVGAGFLYRSRVAALIGDYDRHALGLEDYDYWMRVNALLTLRHADFDDPVVDYRFHGASLTARAEELGLPAARERLMVFDQFRRDLYLSPLVWIFDSGPAGVLEALRQRVQLAGHIVYDGTYSLATLPARWVPAVYVSGTSDPASRIDRADLPHGTLAVLVSDGATLPADVSSGWDVCMAIGNQNPVRLRRPRQGWLVAPDVDQVFHAIDIRAKSDHALAIRSWAAAPPAPELRASVVICTQQAGASLDAAIDSALGQDYPLDRFEVIVVNNNPSDPVLTAALDARRADVAVISCPVPGLSAARNAGLAAARGDYVCYIDADVVAERTWLSHICRALDDHPETAVVGGHILLDVPEPRPPALARGWETFWSSFVTRHEAYTEVGSWRSFPWGANWAARRSALAAIGGFRTAYGRSGSDFGGGEELLAAALAQRLGHRVAIVPDAIVHHHVDPDRFTFEHVRRTMAARHLVPYAASRDMLAPEAPGVWSTMARLAFHHVDPRVRPLALFARDAAYRKAAQFRLLVAQLRDLRRRRQEPSGGGL
jgi:polysaccharide pyruvyl transferase CsaB